MKSSTGNPDLENRKKGTKLAKPARDIPFNISTKSKLMKKFRTSTVKMENFKATASMHGVGIFLFHIAYITMKFNRDFEI